MRHGEIRWYTFTAPDKKRPVLILTRNSILDVLGEVTIAPITFHDPPHSQRSNPDSRRWLAQNLRR